MLTDEGAAMAEHLFNQHAGQQLPDPERPLAPPPLSVRQPTRLSSLANQGMVGDRELDVIDTPPGATAHRLSRDATRLNAVELGQGEPSILCIHGLGGDHRLFGPQITHFAGRHRVVAVDLRGHGASEGPAPRDAIRQFADDVAWQCQQLDLARPVLVGHSGGGHVAAQLAADFPALVSGVVSWTPRSSSPRTV